MKISFHGAAGCVTGSNYLIESSNCRFLVDCGMFQGNKTLKENNYRKFLYDPASIDFVLLTHAHIDHSGLLPKLVKHGFKGSIYATEPTVDILKHMLPDSAHIQEMEVMQKNRRNERKGLPLIDPIYDAEDADKTISMLKGVNRYNLFEPVEGCKVTFHNAGHVLGSSFIEIELDDNGEKRKLIFSGDLGEDDKPIVNDPDRFKDADYLIVESTYGGRNRDTVSKEERLEQLAQVFDSAAKRGGKLIIPAFALERTQDLLHDILTLKKQKRIGDIKVVVDSPLATEITKVFMKYPEMYDRDAREVMDEMGALFDHQDFSFTSSVDESKALNEQNNLVLMSASGMCDAGRIKHHLKHNLWSPENTVLFVGYQAGGTLGRLILQGAKTIRIHGEEISIGAHIEQITGYSGHADQNGLLKWLSAVKEIRKMIFVVHGEPESSSEFASLLNDKFSFNTAIPHMGDTFDLISGTQIGDGEKAEAYIGKAEDAEKVEKLTVVKATRDQDKGVDSHNLYAELMLKLAQFMRENKNEKQRKEALKKLLSQI